MIQHTHQQVLVGPQVDFLRHLLAASGGLSGYDLATGEAYSTVIAEDPEEFLRAHVLGPARVAAPTVDVMTESGAHRTTRAFVRAMVMPCNELGDTAHVAARFKTGNSMAPSEAVTAASKALHRAGLVHYIERSVLTGVWVLWILFGNVVDRAHAESLAVRVREILKLVGIPETSYVIPLLEQEPVPLHLPCSFYSGSFFGVLFRFDDGQLYEIDLVSNFTDGPVDATEELCEGVAPELPGSLDGLLERWSSLNGSKAVRAGELASFARQECLLPLSLSSLPPQSVAISLGRELLDLTKSDLSRFQVTASRSGNSNTFRIGPRGSAGGSAHGT